MYNTYAGRRVDCTWLVMRNIKQVQTDRQTGGERGSSELALQTEEVDWKNTKPTVGRTDS